MVSVDEALRLILANTQQLVPQLNELEGLPLGALLAETVVSDIDSPPYDKSIVDGYALIAADYQTPGVALRVLEEVTAGDVPQFRVEPGTATRIMTGAPIPDGADAVVMIEKTSIAGSDLGELVMIHEPPVRAGQNIMRRGASFRRGQAVLQPGKRLRAIELGLLAEVAQKQIQVVGSPSVAVLCTGNELVDPEPQFPPGPGEIRNSNGPLIEGLVYQAGAKSSWGSKIVRDDKDEIEQAIRRGLMEDVVLITGGVSAGVLDLVPAVLRDLGVQEVFHKVNLKPGKPLWFGVRPVENRSPVLVFGLPGNPVSVLVCFELFVRPALAKLSGREPKGLPRTMASLTHEHRQRGERPTYWPASLSDQSGTRMVRPLPWQGSGDLRTLADANCLAHFPAGDREFREGEEIEVLVLPEP